VFMLSLDCLFFIAPVVFSNAYLPLEKMGILNR
jgi:hypothetical protein